MQNIEPWILIRSALLLAASTVLSAACGGSAEFTAAQAGASGSSAGSANGGGNSGGSGGGNDCQHSCPAIACGIGFKSVQSPGDCCPSCVPDDSGGSGGGCTVACATVGYCGVGYKSVIEPGQCCPTCVPDGSGGTGGGNQCQNVNCLQVACAAGYKYQVAAGECCGTCVPDADACFEGQTEYKSLREKLLADPSALKCTTNADCTILSPNAKCGDECGTFPVSKQAAMSIQSQLTQFGASACAGCTAIYPPCAVPPPPFCVGGQCTFGAYL